MKTQLYEHASSYRQENESLSIIHKKHKKCSISGTQP